MVSTFVAPQLPPKPKNVETLFDLCCQAFAFMVACRDDETSSDIDIQGRIRYDNSGLVNKRSLCGKNTQCMLKYVFAVMCTYQ